MEKWPYSLACNERKESDNLMPAAIYYHPEAYSTTGTKLMGRHAAGESFLRGFINYAETDRFWIQVDNPEYAELFAKVVKSFGKSHPVTYFDKAGLANLAEVGALYHPGPDLSQAASSRCFFGHAKWSLCGITHTTSSGFAMDSLTSIVSGHVQKWDAIICTSNSVKDNVLVILQAEADRLAERLGTSRLVLPQLPVIPLGIHTRDFAFSVPEKVAARGRLMIAAEKIVVLFMGRLSFHAKAHPVAMYIALEECKRRTGREIVLLQCGWFANTAIEKAFKEAGDIYCPNVEIINVDGRIVANRNDAWASADIFCSLADNIQETFGIVPIEAMAAGLPVVVSDWDGYKDTVRHGVDGFRVTTATPEPGWGVDLAARHGLEIDTYDSYCGYTCCSIAVDIGEVVAAFESLVASPELRATMGTAGSKRAAEVYDWKVVIKQYESLWGELAELRESSTTTDANRLGRLPPNRLDPFTLFSSYPTHRVKPAFTIVHNSPETTSLEDVIKKAVTAKALGVFKFAAAFLPSDEQIECILTSSWRQDCTIQDVLEKFSGEEHSRVFRGTVWLAKIGVISINP